MPTNMQNFIEQMRQRQAPMQDAQTNRNLFVMPMRARFMGNTGTGENSTIEPTKPVAMLPTTRGARMIHEGENLYNNPDGSVKVVPAQQSQDELMRMERQHRIPGYATGGFFTPKPVQSSAIDSSINKAADVAGVTPPSAAMPAPITPTPVKSFWSGGSVAPKTSAVDSLINKTAEVAQPSYQATTAARTTPTATNVGAINMPAPVSASIPAPTSAAQTIARTTPTATNVGNIVVPAGQAATTPATPATPTPTGLTYGQQGAALLSDIATGGSKAMQAAQDKYLQDLKATQNVSQRVAGFENAQQGVGDEVASARQAMGRAVAGSQLGQAESQMAANEMQQRENAARDLVSTGATLQGMETTQNAEVQNLINQGYTKDQINQQLGTNFDDAAFSRLAASSARGMQQASAQISAGNYGAANEIFKAAGLPPIDFAKVEAGEISGAITDIDDMIATLGPDADPAVVAGLNAMRTSLWGKKWAAYGIDPNTLTVTKADGTKATITELVSAVSDPTTANPATLESVAKMSKGAIDFFNLPEGDLELEALSSNPAWGTLYDKAQAGDTAAATEAGAVLGALWVQYNSLNDPNSPKPTAYQTSLLDKYDVKRVKETTQAEVQPTIDKINSLLSTGDVKEATTMYGQLTPEEKTKVGSLEDLSATAMEKYATSLINSNNYTSLVGKKYTDPQVQAVLAKLQPPNITYQNNSPGDDTLKGVPAAGNYIKLNTPNGDRLVKVTYKGHLDTAGSSNRAYAEFQDIDGSIYSVNRDGKIVVGPDRTYKRV